MKKLSEYRRQKRQAKQAALREKAREIENEPKIFKHLKRKFVWTATGASAAVLVLAFSIIYIVASQAAGGADFHPREEARFNVSEDVTVYIEERIQDDRDARLKSLLLSLILTGISIEILVAFISLYFAERAVQPVREAYEAQKNFIANASHEIKTPLAVIQANLEAADIQGNQWIDNVAKKTEELASLNNQLLSLARMESSATPEITPEKIDLETTVRETAQFYEPKLAEKGAKLKINKLEAPAEKTLNRPEFVQLLNILIDNAVKYCDKKLEITLTEKSVAVKNDGATIEPDKLPHVFDRFYQIDKAKSGVGLGLAIGKSIADHNKWKLEVSSDKKSTTFTLGL